MVPGKKGAVKLTANNIFLGMTLLDMCGDVHGSNHTSYSHNR